MISRFFIDRPIFAAVLSIVITLTGAIALLSLPIAQYPRITPPAVQVSINYPGASAQVVADTVAAPIEQQVSGVEGMLYMSSQMGNDGSYTLSVTFDLDVDLNTALVMVQNRVTLAMPLLPTSVQNQGITIKKKTPDILMVITFFSPNGRYDDIYLSNYATVFIKDEILRVPGVSDINFLGQRDYSIRAWLDPQRLAARNMTALDVAQAIGDQNLAAASGQIGQPPAPPGRSTQVPIDTLGRLTDPEQFEEIIVKVNQTTAPNLAATPSAPVQRTASGGSPNAAGAPQQAVASQNSSTGLASTGGGTAPTGSQGAPPPTIGLLPRLGATGDSRTTSTSTNTAAILLTGPSILFQAGGTTGGGAAAGGGGTTSGGAAMGGGGTDRVVAPTIPSSGGAGSNQALSNSGARVGGALGAQSFAGSAASSQANNPTDAVVRLRDVARVEMGAQNYNQSCTFDGRNSVGLAVYQLPGTNALDVADLIKRKMDRLRTRFPEGVEYAIPYDTTPFIRESVVEVVRTLFEAVVLVAVVVLVFLQSWRAVLIPLVAVPVAIVGTFSVMAALGFSLNNISLFGLVLAIGIVVDDAIVVVENVERWLEQGIEPKEAARRAMDEVTGPVIAVALVLCAVFVPCAFISGITGQFFRQFAVTIAVSTVISAFNSLTLSPALAAILLKPRGEHRDPLTRLLDLALGWFFRLFNASFSLGTTIYTRIVAGLLRVSFFTLLVYGGLLVWTYWDFVHAPTGFIPEQDKGYILLSVQLPDSASMERTQKLMADIEKIARETPGVAHTVGISGQSLILNANAPNLGSMYVMLEEFAKRRGPELTANAIASRLRARGEREVLGAVVATFGAPPIEGLGSTGGFMLIIEDRGNLGLGRLQQVSDRIVARANKAEGLHGLFNSSRANTPWIYLEIDRTKCAALGVPVSEVFNTLQVYFGSYYVNNFNEFGRMWQVNIQADQRFREQGRDLRQLQVRNNQGQMIRLGTLLDIRSTSGPVMVMRYNMYSATALTGSAAPGTSSGQAIGLMEEITNEELPRSMGTDWTELTYLQLQAGNTATHVFALAVVFVFLVLAAQYESWTLPLAVILVVPMCLFCSIAGLNLAGMEVNIFSQIGFVVPVGLASKNAILIVEFAKQRQEEGVDAREATLQAARLRLRPILMTSFAFIFGVLPLVVAQGAGAEMRQALGLLIAARN